MAYKYPIHRNAIPQCDVFEENGYTKEEMKLVRETQKILDDKTIAVTVQPCTYREVTAKR
jgi:aspartate-semialdehyde dehydrogenase